MTRTRILAAPLALALAAGLPMAAFASPDRDQRRSEEQRAITAAAVDAAGAIAAVRAAGYGTIREVDWERGAWAVKATGSAGQRVALRVDAQSGAVTPRQR